MRKLIKCFSILSVILIIVGICMVGAVFSTGSLKDMKDFKFTFSTDKFNSDDFSDVDKIVFSQEEAEKVTKIDINGSYACYNITAGSELSIQAESVIADSLTYSIDGDTLKLEYYPQDGSFSFGEFVDSTIYSESIINIVVPEKEYEAVKLAVSCGTSNLNAINTGNADINIGTGDILINSSSFSGSTKMHITGCDAKIINSDINNMNITASTSNIIYNGIITGNVQISASMVSADFTIDGDIADYDFVINNTMSTLTINDKQTYSENNTASNKIDANITMSDFKININ